MEEAGPLRIPYERLSHEALHALIVELVTRDGTELTDADVKVAEVRGLLEAGEAELYFDPETESMSVVRIAR